MMNPPPLEPLEPLTPESLRALAEHANAGDPLMVEKLRRTLDANPEVWQKMGDLSSMIRASLISAIVGNNTLHAESLMRNAAALMQSLLRRHAT